MMPLAVACLLYVSVSGVLPFIFIKIIVSLFIINNTILIIIILKKKYAGWNFFGMSFDSSLAS
jgi:hypothetical protein